MEKNGKSLTTEIFYNRDEARIFLEELSNKYSIVQSKTLKNAIEAIKTLIYVDEIIVISMKCNEGKEKKFFYEIERTDHKMICVIM